MSRSVSPSGFARAGLLQTSLTFPPVHYCAGETPVNSHERSFPVPPPAPVGWGKVSHLLEFEDFGADGGLTFEAFERLADLLTFDDFDDAGNLVFDGGSL